MKQAYFVYNGVSGISELYLVNEHVKNRTAHSFFDDGDQSEQVNSIRIFPSYDEAESFIEDMRKLNTTRKNTARSYEIVKFAQLNGSFARQYA